MGKKHMKKCSLSLPIKEMQIKTTLRFHLTSVRIAIIKTTPPLTTGGDKEPLYTAGGTASYCNHSGKKSRGFLKIQT
jgi:hypothetical protein